MATPTRYTCEYHYHIVGTVMEKLWEDLKHNLAWCLNAKNSMENNNGFSPYQLAIAMNLILPNNLNAKPPALKGIINSEVVTKQLQIMHESGKAFTLAESSGRLCLCSIVWTYTEPSDINMFTTSKMIQIDGQDLLKLQVAMRCWY